MLIVLLSTHGHTPTVSEPHGENPNLKAVASFGHKTRHSLLQCVFLKRTRWLYLAFLALVLNRDDAEQAWGTLDTAVWRFGLR